MQTKNRVNCMSQFSHNEQDSLPSNLAGGIGMAKYGIERGYSGEAEASVPTSKLVVQYPEFRNKTDDNDIRMSK